MALLESNFSTGNTGDTGNTESKNFSIQWSNAHLSEGGTALGQCLQATSESSESSESPWAASDC